MENKERLILSEIMNMMASIRSQLELLDAKVAELQLVAAQEDEDMAPIDLDLDGFDDLPFDDVPQPEVEEPVVEDNVKENVKEVVEQRAETTYIPRGRGRVKQHVNWREMIAYM